MREFEKKMMLTKEAYDYLLQSVGQNAHSTYQTNYYFDTDDFNMNKRGITCRIRQKSGCFTATIKNHNVQKLDCSIENDLSVTDYLDLEAFSSFGARLQGDLITERTVLLKDPACEMVLDRNSYLGTVDYELEIEYLLDYEEKATQLLKETIEKLYLNGFDIGGDTAKGKSKSERFFERKLLQRR